MRVRDAREKCGRSCWNPTPRDGPTQFVLSFADHTALLTASKGALQELLDCFPVAPSCGDPLTISEDQQLIALIERLGRANLRRVHDGRAMHAKKNAGR